MSVEKNEAGLYEVKIDENTYEFEKWGAEDATDTILDIAAIAGKPIGAAVSAFLGNDGEERGLDRTINPDVIGTIMESLSGQVGANKAILKGLIKKLSSDKVLCDGKKVVFNTHYQDRLDHLFRVVRAGLEVQYGNFLSALIAVLPAKAKGAVTGLTNRGA